MKYLLIVVLLFSFGQASAARFVDGSKLLEHCEAHINNTSVAKGNFCAGYIAGVFDVHDDFVYWGDIEKKICIPDNVESNQLVRVVTKYLQEHPEKLHIGSSSLVIAALRDAFRGLYT